MTSSSFFWRCSVSLVTLSHWSKFHVNIIIGSGIMTIFFYKKLTKNPEIGNSPIWVLHNIWRLGQVRDTKFGNNVSNKKLSNAEKSQGYSCELLRKKPTVGVKLPLRSPCATQIRVKMQERFTQKQIFL